MNYEQKYKQALERARAFELPEYKAIVNSIFPELKESEDERIRKRIIHALHGDVLSMDETNAAIAWLEKQGDIDKISYDIAEKEKNDFVSGQFIECRKSFKKFKEDNSYWLEYIGNDTYIGRSDNILNEKLHITPRQLFTLFTQQHCPKEDNTNDETNAPTEYSKYVDECLGYAAEHFFSEGEDTYSVADLFYAGVRCGRSWLEKQGDNSNWHDGDVIRHGAILALVTNGRRAMKSNCEQITIQYPYEWVKADPKERKHFFEELEKQGKKPQGKTALEAWKDMRLEAYQQASGNRHEPNYSDDTTKMFSLYDIDEIIEKMSEQKPINKVEPKFHEGDWVVWDNKISCHIDNIYQGKESLMYAITDTNNMVRTYSVKSFDKNAHLWTIQDAKEGDVLVDVYGNIGIYEKCDNFDWTSYYSIGCNGGFQNFKVEHENDKTHPATKEQRDQLFKAVTDAGYEWDAEKKELKKFL